MLSPASHPPPARVSLEPQKSSRVQLSHLVLRHKTGKAVPVKGCVSSHWRYTGQARGQSAERMFWTLLGRVDHMAESERPRSQGELRKVTAWVGSSKQARPGFAPAAPSAFYAFPKT